jgi:hypothetical protein
MIARLRRIFWLVPTSMKELFFSLPSRICYQRVTLVDLQKIKLVLIKLMRVMTLQCGIAMIL